MRAPTFILLLLTLCSSMPAQEELPEIEAGRTLRLTMRPGEARSFLFVGDVDGVITVWASSETLDSRIEVHAAKGMHEDDDSGGGKTPFIAFTGSADDEYRIDVHVKAVEDGGAKAAPLQLRLVETQITPEQIARRDALGKTAAEIANLREAGKVEVARKRLGSVVEGLRDSGAPTVDSESARILMDLYIEASLLGDLAAARTVGGLEIESCRRILPPTHDWRLTVQSDFAGTLVEVGEFGAARAMLEEVIAIRQRLVPPDDDALLKNRNNLAAFFHSTGNLIAARELFQEILATRMRTQSADHPEVITTRMNLAAMIAETGEPKRARDMLAETIEDARKVLEPDHPDMLTLRENHAVLLMQLGDLTTAEKAFEELREILGRTLPADHPKNLNVRFNLASVFLARERLAEARDEFGEILEAYERVLPPGHPALLPVKINYAAALKEIGEIHRARDVFENVISTYAPVLPADHPDLLGARVNYAATLKDVGELERARAIEERVLDVWRAVLPADHPQLLGLRQNYAMTLGALGDLAGRAALEAEILSAYERTMAPDHPHLLGIQLNYASTLEELGDVEGARKLQEKVIAAYERTLDPEAHALQKIRTNHASLLTSLGEFEEALLLERKVLEIWERTLPPEHPDLRRIRETRAVTLSQMGRLSEARAICEEVLALEEKTLPGDHPDLRRSRENVVSLLAELGTEESLRTLEERLIRFLDEDMASSSARGFSSSTRQVAIDAAARKKLLDLALSGLPHERLQRDVGRSILEYIETLAGQVGRAHRLRLVAGAATGDVREEVDDARARLGRAGAAVDEFLAAPSPEGSARLANLLLERERAEANLTSKLSRLPSARELLRPVTLSEVAARLPADSVAVKYVRHESFFNSEEEQSHRYRLLAFVLTPGDEVRVVSLGPARPVTRLIEAWRHRVGAPLDRGIDEEAPAQKRRELGADLRRRLLDPVVAAAGEGVKRLFVTLSDDLHLLPLDALPATGSARVGDDLQLELVHGLQWLVRRTPGKLAAPSLVALGDVDFLGRPKALSDAEKERFTPLGTGGGILPVWQRGFRELPFTEIEIRALAKTYRRAFEDDDASYREPVLLRGRRADKVRFLGLAPGARFLHLATHGWFAPESVPSILDDVAQTRTISLDEQIRGYSPLALCGLALTGANIPPESGGAHPGLLTGSEIAAMDLSGVELAVLSACETNVGVRRAGQGIMSLQEALFSAGVRYSITSLWAVPDEATMELMTRFYEGLWRRGETKREALWAAKTKLRRAKNPATGKPKYGVRDWAGWVLVGNPE